MRKTQAIHEISAGRALTFLYETLPGRCVLKLLTRRWVSKAVGAFLSTPMSRPLIAPFIRKHGIDMRRYAQENYPNYNAFFTRALAQPVVMEGEGLCAPCDARLTAYPIDESASFSIKGSRYTLPELLRSESLTRAYQGGTCLIFRLCVDDYHRYAYFDDCTEGESRFIPGILHTVQPIAFRRYNVYKENCREYTVLHTKHFGQAVQMEVGATCVGKILNHHKPGQHHAGEEKGMFLFGGSTVVLLLKQGRVDPEILANTQNGLETFVHIGEKIGEYA